MTEAVLLLICACLIAVLIVRNDRMNTRLEALRSDLNTVLIDVKWLTHELRAMRGRLTRKELGIR